MEIADIHEKLHSEYETYELHQKQLKYALPCVPEEELEKLRKLIKSSYDIIIKLEDEFDAARYTGYIEIKKSWMS